ncbi:MAG: ATP-binding protein [Vulcanimicrobiaceae bacterium]
MAVATSGSRHLEIRLFGEPAFYSSGALLNAKLPAKSLVLLCALALSAGQPLDRTKLAFTLWPDDSEDEAKAKLRRHLHLLSRAIASAGGESQLQATNTTLTWLTDGPITIDVVEFTRLSSSADTLDRAAALYAGELLATLYEDWLEAPRERLSKRQLQNLLALSSRALHSDPKRALAYADAALRIDPWCEDAVRSAIVARTQLGDRAGAMYAYDEFARRLREEFEIEPAAETKRALQTAKSEESYNNNLPRQLTSFVGREDVVAEIEALLKMHRLVTLVGTGGAGKTRCAIQVGARFLDGSGDGAWLAELAPIFDPSLVESVVARALGVQESPDRPIIDTLRAYLKRKRLVLVLDNCEHVIEKARSVAGAILHDCPEVRILATSREGLNIAGEQIYRMPSLTVPPADKTLTAQTVLTFGAPLLFADRAGSVDNRFALTDENASHVAEVCRRLDGIPLAIELAAARVNVLSPKQLAEKLDERFRVLTGGDRSALPRHQTMRALIDWSYDLLSDQERALFRRLAIFAGGFTLERASVVCSDGAVDEIAMLDLLSSLVDKSLVLAEPAGNGTRYRLLESMRQYARERLTERDEYEAAAHAHATAFLALAEELEHLYETTSDRAWAAQVEPEMENWRAALAWTLAGRGDLVLGQRLASALRWMWFFFAPAEGRAWVRSALDTTGAGTPDAAIAKLDLAQAQLSVWLIQYKASYNAAENALSRFEQLGDVRGAAEAGWIAGRACLHLERFSRGETRLRAARAAAEQLGLRKLTCWILAALAHARTLADDAAGARARYAEALAIARATGFERMVAVLAGMLAEAEFRTGDATSALRLLGEGLDAARAHNDTRSVATDLCNMAAYLTALGRFAEARSYAREALTLSCDVQFEVILAFTLQHFAATVALQPAEDAGHVPYDRARAARLLGYVDTRLTALDAVREYTEQQEYDKMLPALRDAFGADEIAKLMEEGGTWSEDQAFAEAMRI